MFHATDAQFSSVAVLLDNGSLLERVAYSAYGVARHQWRTDVNGDGAVNAADLAVLLSSFGAITTGSYTSEADLDRNGVVNATDLTILLGYYSLTALPEGTLSSPPSPTAPATATTASRPRRRCTSRGTGGCRPRLDGGCAETP